MKKAWLCIIAVLFLLTGQINIFAQSELQNRLSAIHEISKTEKLESTEFSEKYLTYFTQKTDHQYDSAGTFQQRVIVFHAGFDRPTVIVTEGYGGAYALRSGYREEISKIFNTNIIFVEHRYFLESTPQPCDWQYLTAKNSAEDLHAVFTAFKKIYPQKWISTGISKGGQTALIYRTFFPDDVDISVPYVAPLCFAVEDGRHEPFLKNVSTAENRNKIQNFQLEVLKRRAKLMPEFEKFCNEKKYQFSIPVCEIYDFCVLEYSFAFWQWGTDISEIPPSNAADIEIFNHFMKISDPSYFGERGNSSFFVQAIRELGYYGYDTEPFKEHLKIKSSKNYLQQLFLPEDAQAIAFDSTLSCKIVNYLKNNDPEIIFIYGENDPWTAVGVTWLGSEKQNTKLFVQPNGSHRSRILTLPEKMKNETIEIITKWLDE